MTDFIVYSAEVLYKLHTTLVFTWKRDLKIGKSDCQKKTVFKNRLQRGVLLSISRSVPNLTALKGIGGGEKTSGESSSGGFSSAVQFWCLESSEQNRLFHSFRLSFSAFVTTKKTDRRLSDKTPLTRVWQDGCAKLQTRKSEKKTKKLKPSAQFGGTMLTINKC